jgi:Carboxypeptidase regulatory-like domain
VKAPWSQTLFLAVVVITSACANPVRQTGRVEGHVLWNNCESGICDSTPWTKTPVRFRSDTSKDFVAISTDDGSYAISLAPGTYSIIVPAETVKGRTSVTVASGQTLTVDFLLHKPGG